MWFLPDTRIYVRKRRRARRARRTKAHVHHYLAHKERARALIHERLAYWSEHYRISYGRVAIRNPRTRWGSCSTKGNLNFSYKLMFLPEHLIDYVIVHELCHLLEFNHSTAFWEHVARTIPDHHERKKELRLIALHELSETSAQSDTCLPVPV